MALKTLKNVQRGAAFVKLLQNELIKKSFLFFGDKSKKKGASAPHMIKFCSVSVAIAQKDENILD